MMIEIEEAIVSLREDGIVHVHFKEFVEITVELQGRMYDIYNEICGHDHKPFLFTADEFVSVTKEARNNSIIMEGLYPGSASAVLVTSIAYKLIANFYLIVNKPKSPYRVFNNEEDAVEWLKTYL
jgi:hypothetical protein